MQADDVSFRIAEDANKTVGRDVEAIVAYVSERATSGDVIAVLSNGGFGGIHEKLLSELA